MALQINQIAAMPFTFGVPEMVETRAQHGSKRGKRANVAAQIAPVSRMQAIGAHHHHHCVPAHVGAQALFDLDIAGATRFLIRLNGVHVARGGRKRQINAVLARVFQHFLNQKMCAFCAFAVNHGGQRIQPLFCFLLIRIHDGGAGKVFRVF